ncbi:MAG: hypothetical protein MUC35_00570 [Candidatus Margulisbacteria bacterium]|jgi:hypothetical protein|nr:hypothetical protein [Candidatus Margulisiibacteriota bacterium]
MKIERHYEDFMKPGMIEEGGIIRLSGKFLLDHEDEVLNLIKHEGKLAEQRNPGHKVVKIEKADGGISAEISDHNLALHIGKALSHAYQGEHEYKFLKGEKFVEVKWRRDD